MHRPCHRRKAFSHRKPVKLAQQPRRHSRCWGRRNHLCSPLAHLIGDSNPPTTASDFVRVRAPSNPAAVRNRGQPLRLRGGSGRSLPSIDAPPPELQPLSPQVSASRYLRRTTPAAPVHCGGAPEVSTCSAHLLRARCLQVDSSGAASATRHRPSTG